jgi:hypothetical protein
VLESRRYSMSRLKLFSIKGEFGKWQVRAVNREKAIDKLYNFFDRQDKREIKLLANEKKIAEVPVPIPKGFF